MDLVPAFFGYNFLFWVIAGLLRFISESWTGWRNSRKGVVTTPPHRLTPDSVAVIMAAHNEASAISATIKALKKSLPASNMYIGSDASIDDTARIAREHGCTVVELNPNRGKAKTLAYLLEHFNILDRYRAVLIMDAEVVVSDDYLARILPYFDDPQVVAFVSHAHSYWKPHKWPQWSMLCTAYRMRLWFTLYYGLRYGQTWKYTNVTPIIPGGSSVYRSSALRQLEIDTPGLIIEDFHMTFQIHHKKLGRIASHPSAYILDQEPYSIRDYTHQVYRWFLGFWQTFFHHGFWPGAFWFATALFVLEMCFASIVVLVTPLLMLFILLTPFKTFNLFHLTLFPFDISWAPVTLTSLLIGVFVLDYVVTILVAIGMRKPLMLVYGFGFFILRFIDTFVFLWTLPMALFAKTATGMWVSPTRLDDPQPRNI